MTITRKFAFPVRFCTRCGGGGEYSFNTMHGSRCYGCNGSGVQPFPGKVAAFTVASAELKTALLRPVVRDIAAGDRIRRYGTTVAHRTIVAIEHAPEGHPSVTDITFEDGAVERFHTNEFVQRELLSRDWREYRRPLVDAAYAALTKKQREENDLANCQS